MAGTKHRSLWSVQDVDRYPDKPMLKTYKAVPAEDTAADAGQPVGAFGS